MKGLRIQASVIVTIAAVTSILVGLTGSSARAQGHNYLAPQKTQPSPMLNGRVIQPSRDVGLDQKIGEKVPLDLPFVDEHGKAVKLGDYLHPKRAVLLNLVFYRCPGVCTLELDGLSRVFSKMRVKIGQDFDVVTVSINPKEGPNLAIDKKEAYLNMTQGQPGARDSWHFLTGKQEDILALAHAIGYRYAFDLEKEQFAHPAGITLLTPDGTISKYFYGSSYKVRDLQLGLVEASENHVGTMVDQVLLLCLHYDATTGKYTAAIYNILKIAAALTVIALVSFWIIMARWEKKRALSLPAKTANGQPTSI